MTKDPDWLEAAEIERALDLARMRRWSARVAPVGGVCAVAVYIAAYLLEAREGAYWFAVIGGIVSLCCWGDLWIHSKRADEVAQLRRSREQRK